MTRVWMLAVAMLLVSWARPTDAQEEPRTVQVMVLGTYHFANPGLDVVNVRSDSVLSPQRQRELDALADALARFRPTRILVEQQATGPDFELVAYRDFRPEMLQRQADERVQIGYRLAYRLGHRAVYGFDEQPDANEPNYFPLDTVRVFADEAGQSGVIDEIIALVQQNTQSIERAQATSSIAELLQTENRPDVVRRMHGRAYYGLLGIGDGERQPGAEFNAYWFMRNAKMFAKLMRIARPGDRVLVVVGGGHKFWLDHLAELTPGFERVDPMPYLEAAAAVSREN
jgi:hypothetical protein